MNTNWIILILFAATFSACRSDNVEQEFTTLPIDKSRDFIVFGEVYGECTGSCRSLFLLYNDAVYEDKSNSEDPLKESYFSSTRLDESEFLSVANLLNVPESIRLMEFSDSNLVQYIDDVDTYLYGKKDGLEFEYQFDAVELDADVEAKEYLLSINSAWIELRQ